jgi:hypothetical protein
VVDRWSLGDYDPETALQILKNNVHVDVGAPSPDLAKSSTPCCQE